MLAIDETTIEMMSRRRAAGERVSALAVEVGISWQKLDKLMRHGLPDNVPPTLATDEAPTRTPAGPAQSLTKQFSPAGLGDVLGQPRAVAVLRAFVARPYPAAMLFEGATGVGKTSAALALAAELGCDVEAGEFGGLRSVASGEQTADAVRDAVAFLHFTPFCGRGWKVLVVNEADRMSTAAETIWLDALERLPARSVVVFTTNKPEKLSDRFRDRCLVLHFEDSAKLLSAPARQLIDRAWHTATGRGAPRATAGRILREATRDGRLSFRRVLQSTERELLIAQSESWALPRPAGEARRPRTPRPGNGRSGGSRSSSGGVGAESPHYKRETD